MSTFDQNIGTAITIRDFLSAKKDVAGATMMVTIGTEEKAVTNVNVVWDGGEYYITYTDNNATVINKFDNVLPAKIIVENTAQTE